MTAGSPGSVPKGTSDGTSNDGWETVSGPTEFPTLTFGSKAHQTVRYFPDKMPIGMRPAEDLLVFLFLVTQPSPCDFRLFLGRHAELFRALRTWTLRLLVPAPLRKVARNRCGRSVPNGWPDRCPDPPARTAPVECPARSYGLRLEWPHGGLRSASLVAPGAGLLEV